MLRQAPGMAHQRLVPAIAQVRDRARVSLLAQQDHVLIL
jgi:hypothetical protein